jgi:hypothetical protein
LGAITWMIGIAFLALAVDHRGRRAGGLAASGGALLLLGWLASRVSGQYALLAAGVAAYWLVAGLMCRLSGGPFNRLKQEVTQ